jgi:hypothetical protein
VAVGPGGVIVGVSEGVGVIVAVGVRVGKVGTGVTVYVDCGVLLGLMVAVASGVSGVQVACRGNGVALGSVGTRATLATVGNGVFVAKAAAICALALSLTWLIFARNPGERMSIITIPMTKAAMISSAAVNTFKQLLKQPLLEFF